MSYAKFTAVMTSSIALKQDWQSNFLFLSVLLLAEFLYQHGYAGFPWFLLKVDLFMSM